MKQQTKSKALIILNIILLLALFTIPVYAYWASNIKVTQTEDKTDTIQVGEGVEVTTTVEVTGGADSELKLVPVGREVNNISVSSITFTFDVEWAGAENSGADGATGNLSASAVLSGADQTELDLFTVSEYTTTEVTYGDTTQVSITVTFTNEPVDVAQYNIIKNTSLNLTVTFEVELLPNA